MKKENKHDVESLNHDHNWLKMMNIEIYKLLINSEYIDFFIIMNMRWRKDDGSTSSSRKLIIPPLPHFEKPALSQFKLYIETQTMTQCFMCLIFKRPLSFDMLKSNKNFFYYFTHVKDKY